MADGFSSSRSRISGAMSAAMGFSCGSNGMGGKLAGGRRYGLGVKRKSVFG
jgi:hypothetical protein